MIPRPRWLPPPSWMAKLSSRTPPPPYRAILRQRVADPSMLARAPGPDLALGNIWVRYGLRSIAPSTRRDKSLAPVSVADASKTPRPSTAARKPTPSASRVLPTWLAALSETRGFRSCSTAVKNKDCQRSSARAFPESGPSVGKRYRRIHAGRVCRSPLPFPCTCISYPNRGICV